MHQDLQSAVLNRHYGDLAFLNVMHESGEIDDAGWHREVTAYLTRAYLASDNPRGQSGHSSQTEEHWEQARRLITDAINRDGTFLDIGCASGYLMECVERWCRAKGIAVEPHGLDLSPELADLARRRLPQWTDRIFIGNAMSWLPPRRFDFVRTSLEYVPLSRTPDFVRRLLREVVATGGRLIIGCFNEQNDKAHADPTVEAIVASWGFEIAGRTERPHHHESGLVYRAFRIDR